MLSKYKGTSIAWALISGLFQRGAHTGFRFRETGNRYRPHQGKQEVARRRRQIAAGMLRVTW